MVKPKRKSGKVDEKTKKKALAEYKNTGNASAVARKYGVARSTFLAWLPEFTLEVKDEEVKKACIRAIDETSKAVVRSIDTNSISRQELIKEHYTDLADALHYNLVAISTRLKEDPQGIPFRDLAASLTALANVVKEFLPVEEQGTTQINLLQQTVNNNQ